jgi:transaldolase
VAKSGRKFEEVLAGICEVVDGPISAEVVSTQADGMIEEGKRLDDIGEDGMAMVAQLVEIFDNYDYPCEVLVASVRNPIHFVTAARMGADVATCPFNVLQQIVKHPLTDLGLERFLADWEKAKK